MASPGQDIENALAVFCKGRARFPVRGIEYDLAGLRRRKAEVLQKVLPVVGSVEQVVYLGIPHVDHFTGLPGRGMAAEDVLVEKVVMNWSVGKDYIEIEKLIAIFNTLVAQGMKQLDPDHIIIPWEAVSPFRRTHIHVKKGETDMVYGVYDPPGRESIRDKITFQGDIPWPSVGNVEFYSIMCICQVHIWPEIWIVSLIITLEKPGLLLAPSVRKQLLL
ncbi:MAG: hypothetical protein BWY76_00525 [bacterium ADurb.Bin429]|nr:MAG: hypothetical protein BWY76_00525 [bacterium ADurb.Bin429]